MKNTLIRALGTICLTSIVCVCAIAQTSVNEYKKASLKIPEIFNRVEDSLKKEFANKNLSYPPTEMYLRSFKYDRQLEVWVKGEASEPFQLFSLNRTDTAVHIFFQKNRSPSEERTTLRADGVAYGCNSK